MAQIHIEHDGEPISGEIRVDGGKHAFAHSLACAALADRGRLTEVPDHVDARALREALTLVFDEVYYDAPTRVLTFARPMHRTVIRIGSELAGRSRNLFCLLPALLLRADEVAVEAAPQGCRIGTRPTDWYHAVLGRFGVRSRVAADATVLSWPRRHAADVRFEYPSMTGTVIAVAAAAAAPGHSTIVNASVEPSCAEQLGCLRAMGGRVDGGLPAVAIDGGTYDSVEWLIAPDRIHAVTYLTAALLTRGRARVTASGPLRIPRFVEFLGEAGVRVTEDEHSITAEFPATGNLRPVSLDAGSEPLFSSDWVTCASLLLAVRGSGPSRISDDVFLGRFQYVENLVPFGLSGIGLERSTLRGREAVIARIDPVSPVLSAGVFGSCADIRGTATLVLAGLVADGPCIVSDDFHLRRGYTDLPGDLNALAGHQLIVRAKEVLA